MSKRFAILAATSPLALLAVPAMAQVDDRYADVAPVSGADYAWEQVEDYSDPVIQDVGSPEQAGASYVFEGDDGETLEWSEEGYHTARRVIVTDREGMEHGAMDHRGMDHRMMGHEGMDHRGHHGRDPRPATPVLAYGAAERAEWLSQCRALQAGPAEPQYYTYERDEGTDGGLVGGLLGAVAGGVVGNRVADGHRLLGTAIGAGLGGLAGLVVGAAIDRMNDHDDDEDRRVVSIPEGEPGFDYCEAYLINYERGYGTPGQMAYAPVMMVPVAQQGMAAHGARRMIVEEIEIDEEEAPTHARRAIHRRAAPEGDKREPIR